MDNDKPIHSSELEVNGEYFSIAIYSSAAGSYFAKTCLGEDDVIITDGRSVDDALAKHQNLLPLAIGTRELTLSYLGAPRRFRGRRP
ncbi:hypothetical protein [Geomonas sp.]|uniref:hypothetical protein n=1 Tax=Geomonas sp. TaxID=2651584 RepID=UPI002B4713DA|nr:hypothetical protein [Geomonas sp.]HJV35722.1 hypothetical protein [Geomonas sp.]